MKKNLLFFASYFLTGLSLAVHAQDYQSIPIAYGLNADVIANGVGTASSSTSIDIDGVNYNYIATDYQLTASSTPLTYGIPANGLINSIVAATPGLSYQLAPLSGNNSLRLADGDVTTGTITFTTPISAINLYMLAVTGSGAGTANVVVNFDDDTSQTFNGIAIPDWYNATDPPPAIMGIGRINRETDGLEANATNPRMYQITLAISESNQSKLIESVQVTQVPVGGEVVNVFAFSAEVYTSCPAPTDITAVSTDNGATISWELPEIIPSEGFDYYITSTYDVPGDDVTLESLESGETSVTVSGYDMGETYYFWIRSNCGDVEGFWRSVTFTPGQMSFVYTDGDISTNYLGTPTPTSETTCPGNMTINVPDGFEIVSVATSYDMSTASNGYKSEQRSLLACITSGLAEDALAAGTGTGGTESYNRSGLTIADGLTGEVEFELRAWRTYQGFQAPICGVTHNKVDNNTWTITITYAPLEGGCDLDAPVAENQDFCGATTVEDLMAEGVTDAELHWYLTEDSEDELDGDDELETGTYYVSQSVGTCESARTAIEVTVTVTPAPDPAEEVWVCEGTTVFDLPSGTLDGAEVHWYANEEGGEALEDVAVESGMYYVSQSVDGCESERAVVEIEVVEIEAPEYEEVVTLCAGTTIADLQEGTDDFVIFYISADAEEALPENTEIETGTYYVSTGLMDCESERVAAEFLAVTAETPEPAPSQVVCSNSATVQSLDAGVDGEATIVWYDEQGTELTPEDILADGSTYYVSSNVSGCVSEMAAVTVTVNPTPGLPIGSEIQEFNTGETVVTLEVDFIEGTTQNWYLLDEDVWVEISLDEVLVDGGVYYVTQTIDGCTSDYLVITANEVLGTSSFNAGSLQVYPNPATSVLNIAYKGNLKEAVVTNLLGQTVITQAAMGESLQINVEKFAAGTYILQVYTESGESATMKFVKN